MRRASRDGHFLAERREAKHLDLDRPRAVGKIGHLVDALLIGAGDELLVALPRGDRCTRNGQAAEGHLSVVLRRRQSLAVTQDERAHDQAGGRVAPKHDEPPSAPSTS